MYYKVRNLTNRPQHLYDAKGDCIQLGPHAEKLVDRAFLDFQVPPANIIRILSSPDPIPVPQSAASVEPEDTTDSNS